MGLRYYILLSIALVLFASCSPEPTTTAKAADRGSNPDTQLPKTPAEIAQQEAALVEKTRVRDSIKLAQETQQAETTKLVSNEKPEEVKKSDKVEVEKKPKKKVKKRKSPGIMTFAQPIFNYGKIEQGDVVIHDFSFVNTGKSELVINDIRASCGCTQPTYPFLPIAPGETGVIGVKFDSKGKLGKMKPMVTITTNADPAINKIYLEGFVDAPSKKSDSPTPDTSLIQ